MWAWIKADSATKVLEGELIAQRKGENLIHMHFALLQNEKKKQIGEICLHVS